jgi:hypothetical protein
MGEKNTWWTTSCHTASKVCKMTYHLEMLDMVIFSCWLYLINVEQLPRLIKNVGNLKAKLAT